MHITPCSTKEPLTDITTLPGDRYSYDRQCKLFVHPAAYYDKSCVRIIYTIFQKKKFEIHYSHVQIPLCLVTSVLFAGQAMS